MAAPAWRVQLGHRIDFEDLVSLTKSRYAPELCDPGYPTCVPVGLPLTRPIQMSEFKEACQPRDFCRPWRYG